MAKWGILGAICGICAAPFTGGASLALTCAACAGIGYVSGTVLGEVIDNSKQTSQASPEAYNLLGKSIEELNRLREDLKREQEEGKSQTKTLEKQLEEIQAKQQNPELREPHETDESLKNQELLVINELNRQRKRTEELESKLSQVEKQTLNVATTGANAASGSINNANLGNMANNFKPSFTTKLIIAGAVILIVYLLVVKK